MCSYKGNIKYSGLGEFLYIVSLFSMAFDFRSLEKDGSRVQILFFVIFIVFSLIFILYAISRQIHIRIPFLLTFFGGVFVFVGMWRGLYNEQGAYDVLSRGTPAIIYVVAAISTSAAFSIGNTERTLSKLKALCLTFLILYFVIAVLMRGGLNLSTSRYEFVSGAYIAGLGIFALGIAGRFRPIEIIISLLVLSLIMISVTRTAIVILVIQVVAVYFLIPRAKSSSKLRKLTLIALIPLGIIAIDLGSGLGLTDRWIDRLTIGQRTGDDPSGLARLAETKYMLVQFASSPATVLFGNGLAARTSLSGSEALRIAQIFGPGGATGHGVGFGHNNHVSLLFVAGIVAGAPLLLLQFGHGLQSGLVGLRLRRRISPDEEPLRQVAVWGGLIVIGTLIYGFLGPTFLHRDLCLWYGVGTGMLYWSRREESKTRKRPI